MINRRSLLTGIALSLGAKSHAAMISLRTPYFGRGINIHHMLNWPALDPAKPQTFRWPPFRNTQYSMSDAEIAELVEMGFDFVRVTVSPAIFIQSDEEQLIELKRILIDLIGRFISARLRIVVDLHPTDQLAAYSRKALVANINDHVFNRYADVVRFVAGALLHFPKNAVAFELMNEPALLHHDAIRWPSMLKILYTAARQVSPDLLLVLGGAQFDGSPLGGLMALNPATFDDPNIIYTFHYYEPISFTHQDGRVGNRWNQCLVALPWPASSGALSTTLTESIGRISEDKSMSLREKSLAKVRVTYRIMEYFKNNFGPHHIDDAFHRVGAWADAHGISRNHILLGEFGVTRNDGSFLGANEIDRGRWIATVRRAAERERFPWALWAYKGNSSMALLGNNNVTNLDYTVVRALGLKVPARFQSRK